MPAAVRPQLQLRAYGTGVAERQERDAAFLPYSYVGAGFHDAVDKETTSPLSRR